MKPARTILLAALALSHGLVAKAWETTNSTISAKDMLVEIQKLYPAIARVDLTNMPVRAIAGLYRDLCRKAYLGVNVLYLFTDKSYLYTQAADICPLTIFDKGSWSITNGYVVTVSDGSIPHAHMVRGDTYLPIRLVSYLGGKPVSVESVELYLMSREWDFPNFPEEASTNHVKEWYEGPFDPAQEFKLHSLCRTEAPTPEGEKEIKDHLFNVAWRPEFFKEKSTNTPPPQASPGPATNAPIPYDRSPRNVTLTIKIVAVDADGTPPPRTAEDGQVLDKIAAKTANERNVTVRHERNNVYSTSFDYVRPPTNAGIPEATVPLLIVPSEEEDGRSGLFFSCTPLVASNGVISVYVGADARFIARWQTNLCPIRVGDLAVDTIAQRFPLWDTFSVSTNILLKDGVETRFDESVLTRDGKRRLFGFIKATIDKGRPAQHAE